MEKPVLFPIYAPDGNLITRGFPIAPRAGEPTDHPHHFGLWFNYEKVNGLDFWNNSYNIPAEKKHLYGWIRTNNITQTKSGEKGLLTYNANWTDQQKNILLTESTTFIFSANNNERIIDRTTTLTAQQDVSFEDSKDGLLGLRVTHELELPSAQPKKFTDDKGNINNCCGRYNCNRQLFKPSKENKATALGEQGQNGVYYTAKKIMIPSVLQLLITRKNPGYPTFWHARGYGLFAANPLGQKIFQQRKTGIEFQIKER